MQTHFTSANVRKSSNSTPVYAGDFVVGFVRGNTFLKTVSGSKHFLRQPPAIMFDIQSLKDAERYGAIFAQVTDRETGDVYTTQINHIREKPIYKDYGCGAQIGLSLREWTCNGVSPAQKKPKTSIESREHQLTLFRVPR